MIIYMYLSRAGHYLEMGAACITEAGMDNPHYPHSQSGEAFIGEVEDLVCVTRREQAKVHELLVQCEEALRSVWFHCAVSIAIM